MGEVAHGQALIASQKQLLVAMRELEDQMARLEERSNLSRRKTQGRRPDHGERRFGVAPEAVYVEPKPPDPSWITPHQTSYTHEYLSHSYHDYKSANVVKVYSFSENRWPGDYLSWERSMDDWFSYHGVPRKERLTQAIKQLNGSAYKWWTRVGCSQGIKTWEYLKEAMIRKYVSSLPTPDIRERYPRRFSSHGSKEAKRVVPKEGHRSLIHQDQIRPNQRPTVVYDQYQHAEVPNTMEKKKYHSQDTLARQKEKSDKPIFQEKAKVSPILDKFVYKSSPTGMVHLSLSKDDNTGLEVQEDTNSTSLLESNVLKDLCPKRKEILDPKEKESSSQGKSSNSKNLKDQTCYRCHKRGHFAVVCPTKKVLKETSLEEKTDLSMISDSFIQTDLLVQNSCIMHLSLSKGVVTGIKEHESKGEEPSDVIHVMDQKMVQDTKQFILLKEAKPVLKMSYQGKCLTPPLDTGTDVCDLGVGSINKSYMLTEVPRREPDHKLSHEPTSKLKPKSEQCDVQMPSLKVCFTLDQKFLINSMTRLMHLSCPRECEIVLGTKEENTAQREETPTMMLQDAEPMPFKISKVSVSNLNSSLLLDKADIIHLSLPKSFDPGIRQEEGHTSQVQRLQRRQPTNTSCPKKKIILQLVDAIKVSLELSNYVYQYSTTDIMHLLFVQKVEIISGCKEESFKEIPPDNLMLLGESTPRRIRNVATKNLKSHPFQKRCNDHVQGRGVIISYLFKEEPPDASCITKPKSYQGKILNSQRRMKANLLYLGAGYPVSRSKLCQGRGYDTAIKPVADLEVDPTTHSTCQGANQDIWSLKMPYLTNQEGFNHEDNFHGFYTQEEFHTNWNRAKIFTEQEVMNFTIQRFLSPSSCECQPLEEDFSPAMKRPYQKSIMGFNRDLLDFQKARNQEKWSRQEEFMINFPEPAKPTSSMESLQPIQFGSTQSYLWRPGDIISQSEDIPGVLICTITHRIRRILEEVVKPTRSRLWKDLAIFRFDHFQPNQLRPEDIQIEQRHPGDIILDQEEFYTFIPCTSQHRIRRILIYSKLPYLELWTFKFQQLFCLGFVHDIRTFQYIQKVPMMLSYPLKPSRFKEGTDSLLGAKIALKAPTATFRFLALSLICFLSFYFSTLGPLFLSII
ncbi:hypothetical protein N665_4663s0001 [Sinapis alba]|nr:hypothetical protein N665_4663s0001 [Sinapis alba]